MEVVQPFMSVESCRSYIDELYSTDEQKVLSAARCLKNSVIGSNRQKGSVIMQGVVPKLIQIVGDASVSNELRTQATIILGSLTKGTAAHVEELVKQGIMPVLINTLTQSSDLKLLETCLKCMSYLCMSGISSPAGVTSPMELIFADQKLIVLLLTIASQSIANQISVTQILSVVIKTPEEQNIVVEVGGVRLLASLLCSPYYPVLISTLRFVASLCHQNPQASAEIANATYNETPVPDLIVKLMARDKPPEMQLTAAKCITFLHRASAIPSSDPRVVFKTLPCLVCLSKVQYEWQTRVAAVETLAYLTEVDTELQKLASISNHLIPTLAHFLQHKHPTGTIGEIEHISREMQCAAFMAFASLGANDEDIRKKIIETDKLMAHICSGLQDPNHKVRLCAIRCLHSLSRSVQQLRTTFQDHSVWKPLMDLLGGCPDDILLVGSSMLCNLVLEFSPSKEPILEYGVIDLLLKLCCHRDPALRLNGIWALMNMAFNAEEKVKFQILSAMGTDFILRLLQDPEVEVVMKTLGLLRNLLSKPDHIDYIIGLHGAFILEAVLYILKTSENIEVKEQALCTIFNIAGGNTAKSFLMNDETVLLKLKEYMTHKIVKLQVAAIVCISSLVGKDQQGALERQLKMKELGIDKLLDALIQTSDSLLFEKVKDAMSQFTD